MPEIEIWTLADCPRCEEAKAALRKAGFNFIERSMEALRKGAILDIDAMAELAMRDGAAPLFRVDDRFISDTEFAAMMAGRPDGHS